MRDYKRWMEFVFPISIVASLFVIFVPLPPTVMDFLLAANITVAMLLLLSTVFVKTPLELSVFPSLLLGTTLARLALNVGTTRLILTNGAIAGDAAAGGVIQSFGTFVGGNDIAVGLVIFAIIIVIQFVVITKGATRISEVAARFSLDGLPGQQMAIDADLNSGAIDLETAQRRRQNLSAHADFYGAMDGASKFVRGDAIAGILITLINIVGGLVIGLSQNMSVSEAASVFTLLTIGDGLASQLPALLISMAAGILVTRSRLKSDLPSDALGQVFASPPALILTALFLGTLLLADMPVTPMVLIGALCFGIAIMLIRGPQSTQTVEPPPQSVSPPPAELSIEKLLSQDILVMELGVGLIPLADPAAGGNLLNAINQVRKELAFELGIILPKIRVRDNLQLDRLAYRILIQGHPADESEIQMGCYLAVDTGHADGPIPPEYIRGIFNENLHSEPAYWITPDANDEVAQLGYVILTETDVLAGQLKELAFQYAPNLLTRDSAQQLVDETRKASPSVVSELIPTHLSLGEVQQILKSLLAEGVSIRPLSLILETLGDFAPADKNRRSLVEKVRQQLGKHIVHQLTSHRSQPVHVFTLSEELEHRIACAWKPDGEEIKLDLPRPLIESVVAAIQDAARKMNAAGRRPVALVDQSIRPVIAKLARRTLDDITILGSREVLDSPIQIVGEIGSDQLNSEIAA